MNMRKGSSEIIGIVFILAIAGGIVLYGLGYNIGVQPRSEETTGGLPFTIIIQTPDSGSQDDSPPILPPTDYEPPPSPDNFRTPTDLSLFISPNPITMGNWFYGEVVSNGYNTEVTVYARHKGSGEEVSVNGWLGEDGKFTHGQPINIAGYWEFWAEADNGAVESNHVHLTVEGLTVIQDGQVSKSLSPDQIFHVYSHMTGNYGLTLIDHASGIYIPLSSGSINSGGYDSLQIDLSGQSIGSYEVEVIHENGQTATGWGGSSWLTIGR